MSSAFKQFDRLAKEIDNLQVDCNAVVGQEVDQRLVDWYTVRFRNLVEDGVPEAISPYLNKLTRENTNDITRAVILHEALNIQLREEG